MIEKEIKKARLKFTFSHLILSLFLSSFLLIGSLFYQYKGEIQVLKEKLYSTAMEINKILIYDTLDDKETFSPPFWAIINKKGSIIVGYLPVTPINIKEGFFEEKTYLFFITKPYDPLFSYDYLVISTPLKPFYSRLKKTFFLLFFTLVILNFTYGFLIYLLSKQWTKPIVEGYKDLEEFSQTFSHEILTPISTALFYINNPEIKESLIKTKEFIHSYLTCYRYKRFPFLKKEVSLKTIIKTVLSELTPFIEQKHLNIQTNIQNIQFLSFPDLVYLIFKNVIGNAVKYTGENGKIKIEAKKKQKNLLVTITNEAVFSKENTKYGLGLSITKKSLAVLGGNLNMKKERERMITTLSFPLQN